MTEFLHHLNYSAAMGRLYRALLDGWKAVGGQLFNAYSDVYAPTKWGSWGRCAIWMTATRAGMHWSISNENLGFDPRP
ncbi:hypothetical protein ACFQDZ_06130 [Sulfitobacter pacificus]|uniref:hypothetical protein n=1 Tax=Sulfitobacter pacificus TaxID=1499314 RepID=UPI00361F13F1